MEATNLDGISTIDLLDTATLDVIDSEQKITNNNTLYPLQSLRSELLNAAEYLRLQINFMSKSRTKEPSTEVIEPIPRNCTIELTNRLLHIENLLHTYLDHERIDIYSIYDYMIAHKDVDCHDIEIQQKKDHITIRLPCLPPRNRSANALVNQMLAAKIFAEKSFPKWTKWTAKFNHVYPKNTSHIPKDVDNYDYKKTIDLIAYALGCSDNALNFDMAITTIFTDELPAGVYIEIREKNPENSDIPDWEIS